VNVPVAAVTADRIELGLKIEKSGLFGLTSCRSASISVTSYVAASTASALAAFTEMLETLP